MLVFFQDLGGLTEVFARMSAGTSGKKLPLWAGFSFLKILVVKKGLRSCLTPRMQNCEKLRENQTCTILRATISHHLWPAISWWVKKVDSYWRSCRNSRNSHRKERLPVLERADSASGSGGRRRHKMVTLRPERPFTGVSGRSAAKITKKSQKESFLGSAKKSPKITEKVEKYPGFYFWGIFRLFRVFSGTFCRPPKGLFLRLFWDETPVNGRSGRNGNHNLVLV